MSEISGEKERGQGPHEEIPTLKINTEVGNKCSIMSESYLLNGRNDVCSALLIQPATTMLVPEWAPANISIHCHCLPW